MRRGWFSLIWLVAAWQSASLPLAADEPRRLTSDGRLKASPVFCDDGRQVVYAELEKPNLYRLKRLRLTDGSVEPLHASPTASELDPVFSADGSKYAFLRTRGAGTLSLIVRPWDAQGETESGETEIPAPEGASGYRAPVFTPDGKRLVYSFADAGRQSLYTIDLAGGDRRPLTSTASIDSWPHFSPDGRQIVFGSTRDGNYEIYLMDADGSSVRRLTDSPFQDIRPRFSPDGRRIAFVSNRDGNYEIYLIQADGTDQRRVTDHPERDDYPAWHPDGRQLLLVAERDGRHDLYLHRLP
ncbi:MAG: hypothetical protein WD229_01700 [Pirellulales bacterium]